MNLFDRIISKFINHVVVWRRESIGTITVEKYFRENRIVIKRDRKTLSGVYMGTFEPTSRLYWYPHLAELLPQVPRTILALGGGACVYPSYVIRKQKHITVDVVEVDPVVAEAAGKFFSPPKSPRLRLITDDGMRILARAKRSQYDLIFVDVGIRITGSEPPYNMQFADRTALGKYLAVLGSGGTLIFNIITSRSAKDVRTIAGIFRPYERSFASHLAFRVNSGAKPSQIQDIVHIFSRQKISRASLRKALAHVSGRTLSYPKERYEELLQSVL